MSITRTFIITLLIILSNALDAGEAYCASNLQFSDLQNHAHTSTNGRRIWCNTGSGYTAWQTSAPSSGDYIYVSADSVDFVGWDNLFYPESSIQHSQNQTTGSTNTGSSTATNTTAVEGITPLALSEIIALAMVGGSIIFGFGSLVRFF